jgi:hypothetical protein
VCFNPPPSLPTDEGPCATLIRCEGCKLPHCQLICRKIGCQRAFHAKCFGIDQRRWPSVMNDQPAAMAFSYERRWWAPPPPERPCIADYVYEGHPAPSEAARKEAECLEKTRQFMFFHARSSASTANNMASGVRRIRRFGKALGLPHHTDAVYRRLRAAGSRLVYLVARASKVKAQSLSGDRSAISALFASAVTLDGSSAPNPLLSAAGGSRSAGAARSLLGTTLLGFSHVLGEESIPAARLTLRVVLAVQVYCIERAAASVAPTIKL